MKAIIFSGQGSQKKGMGKELFDKYQLLEQRASDILGYSVKDCCLYDRDNQINHTKYTQPLLYVVSCMRYMDFISNEYCIPDYFAGHSLGELIALFAARIVDFETGLKIVAKRGDIMSKVSGKMAAVIGKDILSVDSILKDKNIKNVSVANYNSYEQIAISGIDNNFENAVEILKEKGFRCIKLATSGPFHSNHLKDAADEFYEYLKDIEFKSPIVPVISNYKACAHKVSDIKDNLAMQICNPVKWVDSIKYLHTCGVKDFIEIGEGHVLKGFLKNIEQRLDDDLDTNINNRKKQNCLGSISFKERYNTQYAYYAGGMYKGISSGEMVIKLGNSGMIGMLGCGGLDSNTIVDEIDKIQSNLTTKTKFGLNLLPMDMAKEKEVIGIALRKGVQVIECSSYLDITENIIRYKISGLSEKNGELIINNHIILKTSRPEIVERFFVHPPRDIISELVEKNEITREQAELASRISIVDDICVEADSGGHTDQRAVFPLLPAIIDLVKQKASILNVEHTVNVGFGGGLGDSKSVASAFLLGADFVVTGSINQCTVEAGTSPLVKDMLQAVDIQDTECIPTANFNLASSSKVQVVKRGCFFSSRVKKLAELYIKYDSIDDIPPDIHNQLEKSYFKQSLDKVYRTVSNSISSYKREKAEKDDKYKMLLIFQYYFEITNEDAIHGIRENKINFQINCGPSMGMFNRWVKNSYYENWNNRNVDKIGIMIMCEAEKYLNR